MKSTNGEFVQLKKYRYTISSYPYGTGATLVKYTISEFEYFPIFGPRIQTESGIKSYLDTSAWPVRNPFRFFQNADLVVTGSDPNQVIKKPQDKSQFICIEVGDDEQG